MSLLSNGCEISPFKYFIIIRNTQIYAQLKYLLELKSDKNFLSEKF